MNESRIAGKGGAERGLTLPPSIDQILFELAHRGELEDPLVHFGLDRTVVEDHVIGAARGIAADEARRGFGRFDRLLDCAERRQVAGAVYVDRRLAVLCE